MRPQVPLFEPPENRWVCSRCDHVWLTREARPHTPFHPCRGLAGITAPMTREGERVNVTVKEREDYLHGEIVTRDGNDRPIMAVNVEREHGNDVAVFAPMAQVELE